MGGSRAVICRSGVAVPLSHDHKAPVITIIKKLLSILTHIMCD